jgi:hypothetical protein
MSQVFRDLRQAWRAIRRMPGLSAVVVVSLGVGIGVNAAIFSWIQAIVLQPIPGVAHSGRFQLVEPRSDTGAYPGASWLEYRDLSDRLPSVDALVAFRMVPLNVGGPDDAQRAYGLLVSGNYFSGLGLKPAVGRLIGPSEVTRPGAEPIAVISSGRPCARTIVPSQSSASRPADFRAP